MKAALLLNDVSVAEFSHDIGNIFDKYISIFSDFVEQTIPRSILRAPEKYSPAYTEIKNIHDFVMRCGILGHSDVRYLVNGYEVSINDLHCLDYIVHQIRRSISDLDGRPYIFGLHNPNFTNRDILLKNRSYSAIHGEIERIIEKRDEFVDLYRALTIDNQQVSSECRSGPPIKTILGWHHNTFKSFIDDWLASDEIDRIKTGIRNAEWIIENIKLSKKDRESIKGKITEAEKRVSSNAGR